MRRVILWVLGLGLLVAGPYVIVAPVLNGFIVGKALLAGSAMLAAGLYLLWDEIMLLVGRRPK